MRIITLLGILFSFAGYGQTLSPVQWTTSMKRISDTTFEIRLSAAIQDGWYIYSGTMASGGPMPTKVTYEKYLQATLLGRVQEVGERQQKYVSSFGMLISYYHNEVAFVQQVKILGKLPVTISGSVTFMGCNETMCMPPQVEDFKVVIK